MFLDILAIIGGFAILIGGAHLLVHGASGLATTLGVSQLVIGATIVAFGTSLPELAAVVVAAIKGQDAIGFGNIVGSNIINVLGILGAAAILMPIGVNGAQDGGQGARINPTIVIALSAASVYLLYCMFFREKIGRIDGLILVTGFVLYSWFSYVQDRKGQHGPADPPVVTQPAPPQSETSPNAEPHDQI